MGEYRLNLFENVQPSDFYKTSQEKTLLNWFCFEIASALELEIMIRAGDPSSKNWINYSAARSMGIDLSHQIKYIIVQKQLSTAAGIEIKKEWVLKHVHSAPKKIIDELVKSLNNAIVELVNACNICPSGCLKHKGGRCFMFDDPGYYKPSYDQNVNDPKAWLNQGDEYLDMEKWEDARISFTKFIEFKPENQYAWSCLGFALVENGNFSEAIEVVSKAIEMDPNDMDSHYNLGRALFGAGKYGDAKMIFQNLLDQNPNDQESREYMIKCNDAISH